MFSRRHPYLFFILVVIALITSLGAVRAFVSLFTGDGGVPGFTESVGVVEITGIIADSKDVLADLKRFDEDGSIKAIILRINSPGGAVGPSQEIYSQVRKLCAHKPVIASMGAIAASGGYYVAAAADGIMANPGTLTGSIGVIMEYTNIQRLFDKIGLSPVVIKSGKYKDMGSPLRKMTDAERALLQSFVDSVHGQFVDAVATGRHLKREDVFKIADGRIFSGKQARDLGLVDRLGNFEDAVEWAGQKGGITGKVSISYPPEKKPLLIRYLLDFSQSAIEEVAARFESMPAVSYLYNPEK
ncbi:MAG: signal peptide peptidase SppA [Deltaproteobacteria bacterium]|nr:signal peptide peptidase SppA [Deltaproteobacteria bacterium]